MYAHEKLNTCASIQVRHQILIMKSSRSQLTFYQGQEPIDVLEYIQL